MTRNQARQRRLHPGFAVRRCQVEVGHEQYLADWDEQPEVATTDDPGEARWFGTLREAGDAARVSELHTPHKWIAVMLPEPTLTDLYREAVATVFGEDADDETSDFVRTAFGNFRMREGGGR